MKLKSVLSVSTCYYLSVFWVFGGLGLIFLWPSITHLIFTLRPNSIIYMVWAKSPVSVLHEFYFFNWTNAQDFQNVSVKPKFEEVGPYSFLQTEEKSNITWNENGSVTYQQKKYWFHKGGNLQERITSVDAIALKAAYVTRFWNYYGRWGVFKTFAPFISPSISENHIVSELLFEGYRRRLIKIVRSLPFFAHLQLPNWDNFGWFYQRNGTVEFDGVLNIGTGYNSSFGEIFCWNYNKINPYYTKGECSKISGTVGNFFPQNLKKEPLLAYSLDLRRTVKLRFAGEETVSYILGYRYVLDEYFLDNGTVYPENRCYCAGKCVPSGRDGQ